MKDLVVVGCCCLEVIDARLNGAETRHFQCGRTSAAANCEIKKEGAMCVRTYFWKAEDANQTQGRRAARVSTS